MDKEPLQSFNEALTELYGTGSDLSDQQLRIKALELAVGCYVANPKMSDSVVDVAKAFERYLRG